METEVKKTANGIFIIPTIGIFYLKHYYGYPVIGMNLAWIKWQLIIKIGIKSFKEV